jgi:hypothetical protein
MAGGPVGQPYAGVHFIPQIEIYEFGYRRGGVLLRPQAPGQKFKDDMKDLSSSSDICFMDLGVARKCSLNA